MDTASFLIYCTVATFTPGPTNIVILSTVHHSGPRKAMRYTYGATVGFALLLAFSAMLNSMLISIIPKLLVGMKIIGSIYMLYLAFRIFKTDRSNPGGNQNQPSTFRSGFWMQFINPKVVVFTLTVIPTFLMPYNSSLTAVIIGIMAITLIGFSAFTTWVLFGTMFKAFLTKHDKMVNLLMTLFLAYAAMMIWL